MNPRSLAGIFFGYNSNMAQNIAATVAELEDRLEKLRIEYEKFFVGVEKRAPGQLRGVVERDIRRFLESSKIVKPNDRLKIDNLRSRFVSYTNMWNRTLLEIENGTYRRQVAMARARANWEKEEGISSGAGSRTTVGQADDGSFDLSEGIDSGTRKYDGVFQAYKDAGVAVSYEKLESLLEKQAGAIREKYGARDVQFSVKMEDGKPKISAKPVK